MKSINKAINDMYKIEKTQMGYSYSDVYSFCLSEKNNEQILKITINNKTYLLPCYSQDYIFEEDKTLVINLWNKIVLFSLETGEILFYTGLFDSFVGIEKTDMDYIIITETTVFKLNKLLHYIHNFSSFPYIIVDYKFTESILKIKFMEEENEDDAVIIL